MKTHLDALKEKVSSLKGSAKAVVERKIAELESKQSNDCIKEFTLIDLIEQAISLADELEISVASLENRLSSVMPNTILVPSELSSITSVPTALAKVVEINKTLKSSISRVNSITEQICL